MKLPIILHTITLSFILNSCSEKEKETSTVEQKESISIDKQKTVLTEEKAKSSTDDIEEFFQSVLDGKNPYHLAGVTNKTLIAYNILNKTEKNVSVRITFKNNDKEHIKNKNFTIKTNGQLYNNNKSDIEDAINGNLRLIWIDSVAAGLKLQKGEVVQTYGALINSGKIKRRELPSYIGEDYNQALVGYQDMKIPLVDPASITITGPNGEFYMR